MTRSTAAYPGILFVLALALVLGACQGPEMQQSEAPSAAGTPAEQVLGDEAPAGQEEAAVAKVAPTAAPAPVVAPAPAPTPAHAGAGGNEVASYAISDTAGPTIKMLVVSLNDNPGVVSAKIDAEKSLLNVTFTPGKTNPHAMLTSLKGVDKNVKFVGVAAAEGGGAKKHAGCGNCPSKKSCGKN